MSLEEEYDYLFKIILIGDSGVGKSNLMSRYTLDQFSVSTKSTIGVEFSTKMIKLESGHIIKGQIWDTAGQERYRAITNAFYRGAHGCIIVYDITSMKSFKNVAKWLTEVLEFLDRSRISILLIGNKTDLNHLREVPDDLAKKYAEENHLIFTEASALDNTNVDHAFSMLINDMYEKTISAKKYVDTEEKPDNIISRIKIEELDNPDKSKSDKCKC